MRLFPPNTIQNKIYPIELCALGLKGIFIQPDVFLVAQNKTLVRERACSAFRRAFERARLFGNNYSSIKRACKIERFSSFRDTDQIKGFMIIKFII